MSSVVRRAPVTLALIALVSLGAIAALDAQAGNSQELHQYRPSGAARPAVRRPEARRNLRAQVTQAQRLHAAARRETSDTRPHALVNDRRERVGRSIGPQRMTDGSVTRAAQFAGDGRIQEMSRGLAGSQARVVRYGSTFSAVERTLRPGFVSRSFVSRGHILYTHVYQRHVWRQFGRAFAYETFVPAVRYPATYYGWALAAWPHPITYAWGWQVQPWYPIYGSLFTPYPAYTSPDLWMTDYIIAQSMQTAYQAQTATAATAAPSPAPAPDEPPAADASVAAPAPPANGAATAARPSDTRSTPQPSDTPAGVEPGYAPAPQPAPQPSDAPPEPPPSAPTPIQVAMPPAITPQIKAQLDEEIKVQLQEQQVAAAKPVTLTTESTPPALRPNHVFFQVVQPLQVASGAGSRYCSLSANDYIKRTGAMSDDDWMIPIVVELSRPSDCPEGLHTRIGLNDLSAMENEQEAQVLEAMQAASKGMGPNGPPSGPGVHPGIIADGSVAPNSSALDALRPPQ